MASVNKVTMGLPIFADATAIDRPTQINTEPVDVTNLPEIDLQEVANHDEPSDCWIVLYDRVYNVTKFLFTHPGGEDLILDHAGRDATLAFHGTGHSQAAISMLRNYLIGELPVSQRIFRNSKGSVVLLSGVPD